MEEAAAELPGIVKWLRMVAGQQSAAGRSQAVSNFTKVKMKAFLGLEDWPSPDMLGQLFRVCYNKAKNLLEKMDDATTGCAMVLALTAKEHVMVQACLATMVSLRFGGARVSFLMNLSPKWLSYNTEDPGDRNSQHYLDPSLGQC